MCLAVPGLVESIDDDYADVDFGGVRKKVCVTLLPGLQVGEYVIVHTDGEVDFIHVFLVSGTHGASLFN
jgi:hydrogenase assembly chaperone HypC/HupF